jgi:thiosulfate dehydrogenase (quinone) large subunit
MIADRDSHRIFSGLILIVLGYEWLVSGLDKILSGGFVAGLQQALTDGLSNMQFAFYSRVVKDYFIPNSELLGYVVEVSELALGVAFITLAVFSMRGKMNAVLYRFALATGALAALVSLNLFFYHGGAFFVSLANPYGAGIPMNFVFVLADIAVVVWSSNALLSRPKLYLVGQGKSTRTRSRSRHVGKGAVSK